MFFLMFFVTLRLFFRLFFQVAIFSNQHGPGRQRTAERCLATGLQRTIRSKLQTAPFKVFICMFTLNMIHFIQTEHIFIVLFAQDEFRSVRIAEDL